MAKNAQESLGGGTMKVAWPADRGNGRPEEGGIGRLRTELAKAWQGRLDLTASHFSYLRLPYAGWVPSRLHMADAADVVYWHRLVGTSAIAAVPHVGRVVTVHDVGAVDFLPEWTASPWPVRRLIWRELQALKRVDAVATVSAFTRRRLLHHLPELDPRRVAVIPLAPAASLLDAGCRLSREEARRRLCGHLHTASLGAPILVYVGDEAPRKNVSLLLDVLTRLKRLYPHIVLVKVGRARSRPARQATWAALERRQLVARRDVWLVEEVSDALLAAAYRAADVYVSGSLYEGFGLPPLEALALGTPVVATDCAAHREVLRDMARLAPPQADVFTQAVDDVLREQASDDDKERWRRYVNRFQWESTAQAYVNLLEQVVARREVFRC
jgi:glycosyltransferase involved in cell wall biosynthesis